MSVYYRIVIQDSHLGHAKGSKQVIEKLNDAVNEKSPRSFKEFRLYAGLVTGEIRGIHPESIRHLFDQFANVYYHVDADMDSFYRLNGSNE